MSRPANPLRVAVVGACSSGKSSLVTALRSAGYDARHVAQEHSFVPAMWQRIAKPDVLIYLEVDFENIKARWQNESFQHHDLVEQNRRLAHARSHSDLMLDTNALSVNEVQTRSLTYLRSLEQ